MADGTLKVGTITTSSGSGTITLGQSGETVDMANGSITLNSSMKNTPAFKAKLSDTQTLSNNTTTKLDFDSEMFDTNNSYDPTTNQRFTVPSGEAGKYVICSQVYFDDVASTDATRLIYIYKNGSEFLGSNVRTVGTTGRGQVVRISDLIELSVGDYIEIFGYTNAGTTNIGAGSTRFYGYKIIE